MVKLNKKLLFSLVLASFSLLNSNVFAAEEQTDVVDYSYIDSAVNYEQNTISDAVNTLIYSPNYNNKDISAYTFMTSKERKMEKMKNHTAVLDNDLAFEPTNTTMEDANFWLRPYASIESVKSPNGRVKTRNYGVYAGVNSGLKELGHGWDAVYGAYVGYTGAHLADGITRTNQNGGTIGLETMFFKDNFFTGLSLSTGAMSGELVTERFVHTYMNGGVTSKTGYNFELADGSFIIQPTMTASYAFAHTFAHGKNNDGSEPRIYPDTLHDVLLEPGVNFIYKFDNGFEPYAGVSVVWNVMGDEHMDFTYAAMPDVGTRCFVKYGVGIRKNWSDRIGMNFQTFVRNGGRTGVGFQGGLNFALGK